MGWIKSVVSRLFRPRAAFWLPKTWRAAASHLSCPGGASSAARGLPRAALRNFAGRITMQILDPRRATIHDVAGRIWPAGRTYYITGLKCLNVYLKTTQEIVGNFR